MSETLANRNGCANEILLIKSPIFSDMSFVTLSRVTCVSINLIILLFHIKLISTIPMCMYICTCVHMYNVCVHILVYWCNASSCRVCNVMNADVYICISLIPITCVKLITVTSHIHSNCIMSSPQYYTYKWHACEYSVRMLTGYS